MISKRFVEFQWAWNHLADPYQIVSTDDYMPMPISNLDEYDKVINVSWFTPDKDREELKSVNYTKTRYMLLTMTRFPCVLPFSQMYPLCCIDIRNFLNQFYFFSDDHFLHPNMIDETLKKVLFNATVSLSNANSSYSL
jgi:exocyst complex component 6